MDDLGSPFRIGRIPAGLTKPVPRPARHRTGGRWILNSGAEEFDPQFLLSRHPF
jgi:hypothetical protein